MKRILPLGLAALTAAGLTACGNAPTTSPAAPAIAPGYHLLDFGELPVVGVRASSTREGFSPGNVIDDNPNTMWANAGYLSHRAWVEVRLAQPSRIGGIGIKTGPTPEGATYDVQVSQDGYNWQTVLSDETNSTWQVETKRFPPGVSGSYVRILWHNPQFAQQPHFSIFELKVYGPRAGWGGGSWGGNWG